VDRKGERKMKKLSVKTVVGVGMLSSISYILMLLNFPIPPFPNFLLIDFSDIPALLATLIFGPLAGILVEFFKNVLNYFMTGSATGVPVGHIANFIAGISFILPTYYLYNKLKTYKGMLFSLVISSIIMAIIMSVLNYYIILPAYTFFLHFPAMSEPATRKLVVTGILPFNIIKGVFMSIIFMLLFARMQKWISKQRLI
jgi:riboflavin transporter